MNRRNTISRAEFNEIQYKLRELCELIDKFKYLHSDIDDLNCLADSLAFLERGQLISLKLID